MSAAGLDAPEWADVGACPALAQQRRDRVVRACQTEALAVEHEQYGRRADPPLATFVDKEPGEPELGGGLLGTSCGWRHRRAT